jgi:hypothetical protein
MKPFVRRTLKVGAILVAVVAVSHFALDWHATNRLEAAFERLAPPNETPPAENDAERRNLAALAAAVSSLEASLSETFEDTLYSIDDDPRATSEALAPVVAALAPTFAAFDRVSDTPISLPYPSEDRSLDLVNILNVGRACHAGVIVALAANDVDTAATHARRLARCADVFSKTRFMIHQLARISLVSRSCAAAREVLAIAPNPAALGDLGARSPGGAIESTHGSESQLVLKLVAQGFDRRRFDLTAADSSASSNAERSFDLPFVGPWSKYGLAQFSDYMWAAQEHLDPTPENVVWLRQHAEDYRSNANSFGKLLVVDLSNVLESELRAVAEVAVLRAGATALGHFRERGEWPAIDSLGGEVKSARLSDRAFEITSSVMPDVTWKIEIR